MTDEANEQDTNPGGRLIPLGRFFGVPMYLAPSWVLVALVVTFGYATVIRRLVDGLSPTSAYLLAFGYSIALAACVLLHEIGHTAVSLLLGNPVRRVVVFLLGGVSEFSRETTRPRDELLISLSGPLVSLILAGASWAGLQGVASGTAGWLMLSLLLFSNLIVGVFNLLPGLPLDGGRVLRAVVWGATGSPASGTRAAGWSGRLVALGIVLAVVLVDPRRWGLVSALLVAVVAAFIWISASQALRAARVEQALPELDLTRLLRRGLFVPADMPLALALDHAARAQARGLVVVDSRDEPSAIVDEARVRALPEQRRSWTAVGELARPIAEGTVLRSDLSGRELLAALRRTPAPEYLVLDSAGSPAGILSSMDLAAALGASTA